MAINKNIVDIAEEAVRQYKDKKILPSVITAQAYLETGNGKTELATRYNNYFGEKWYDTDVTRKYDYVEVPTQEERDGKLVTIIDRFCVFKSPIESLNCLYDWYTIYTKYNCIKGMTDYRAVSQLIKDCGYATDSKYPTKLCNIIEKNNLTQYDISALIGIETQSSPHYIRVYAGSYIEHSNALNALQSIRRYVPTAYIVKGTNNNWRIQVGAFIEPKNADALMVGLAANGIDTFKEG